MAERKKDIKKSILLRVKVLYIVFFTIGVSIAAKILYIQYGPNGEELRQKAEKISYETATISADRGDILSYDGRLLATSVPEYEIRMDFSAQGLTDSIFRHNVDSLAYYLASFFGNKSAGAYKAFLSQSFANKSKNRYTLISPRKVNHLEIKEIRSFPLFRLGANRGGFIAVQVNRRLRPHGTLAARTIGMTNASGTKVGIEGSFDSILRGTEGRVLMQKISGNFRIPVHDKSNIDPVDGIDVVSTIDVELQDVAETALRQQLINMNAHWGTAVLMEVSTGEIRAMTNLTRHSDENVIEDFNYAIGMNLEPGSTFKLVSLITLLDDAGATMDETFDTGNGSPQKVGRATVVDTHGYGVLTLAQIFEKSSNVGFAKAVNKYYADKPQNFVDNVSRMGMDKPMELQISGEAKPIVRGPKDRWWDGLTLTMMAYGYAVRVTPLKTLTLYNAVANKGKMMRPMLVTELRQYGQTLRHYSPVVMVDHIASDATIKKVDKAMQDVVDEGTATVLKNPYYKVAGKTGTAQIAQGRGGYHTSDGGREYLATLVGYFPADNPKYSCIVAIKTYRGPAGWNPYYGGTVSGPVLRAIADRVYARSTSLQKGISSQKEKSDERPRIKPGRTDEAMRVANRFDAKAEAPRKSQWFAEVSTKVADTDSTFTEIVAVDPRSGIVPEVVGMGLKDALYILEKEGLTVTFEGRGTVKSQSVKAGEKAQRGMLIALKLMP